MAPLSNNTQKTAHLVISALGDLHNSHGTSIKKICDHVAKEYAVSENDFKKMVKKTLDRGIQLGAVKRVNGRYSLGELIDYVKSIKMNKPKIDMMRRRRRKGGANLNKKRRRRRRRRSNAASM